MSKKPAKAENSHWARAREKAKRALADMTGAEDARITRAALADPDGPPLPETARLTRIPLVKFLRLRLSLSQARFSERYGIPVASVRDWEIHRSRPDTATTAYLMAIDGDPEAVADAYAKSQRAAAE